LEDKFLKRALNLLIGFWSQLHLTTDEVLACNVFTLALIDGNIEHIPINKIRERK